MPKLGLGLSLPQTGFTSSAPVPVRWFKADAGITLSGSNVTAWADQGSYNQDLIFNAGDEAVAPVLTTIGEKNFVNFQSSDYLEGVTEIIGSFIGSAFFVARFPTPSQSTYAAYLFTYGYSGPFRIGVGGAGGTKALFLGEVISSTNLINNTTYLIGTTFNNPAVSFYLNGASVGSGNFSTSSSSYSKFLVGGHGNFTEGAIIAEVIMYDSILTTLERQRVEAYLNTKYAIY